MTNEELQADLNAEWKNLEVLIEKNKTLTSALQGLVRAVDGVDWDCTENQAMGRLDDARSIARAALASQANPELSHENIQSIAAGYVGNGASGERGGGSIGRVG